MKAPSSLKFRLCFFFALLLLIAWGVSAALAWKDTRDTIDEFFDTQQMLFAKRLATSDLSSMVESLPKTKKMLPHSKKKARGDEDDDALSFAIFNRSGELLLHDGEKGEDFLYSEKRGFVNMHIQDSNDKWRIVWLDALNGTNVIAVGQELDYRDDMAEGMLERQLWPWFWLLPVLLIGVCIIVAIELRPLNQVARALENRDVDDATPITVRRLPAEARPLLQALNALFLKIHHQIQRERAFTADAAHELRTPITALKVQAEVAQLTKNPEKQQAALHKLVQGIDRTGNLIDQLLALTCLEQDRSGKAPEMTQRTSGQDFQELIQQHIEDLAPRIAEKQIVMREEPMRPPVSIEAPSTMLAIMVRNILDNAVRYMPEKGLITIQVQNNTLEIANTTSLDASYILPEQTERLAERFYRPPGQTERGSGLGLSIIKRVAEIQGFTFTMCCTAPTSEEEHHVKDGNVVFRIRIGLRACN